MRHRRGADLALLEAFGDKPGPGASAADLTSELVTDLPADLGDGLGGLKSERKPH